ncbi:MAG TPA: cbb3-type cytochrome c oxidase subunit 3 [Devosiaceae bacterium]
MTGPNHETLVGIAKYWGLLYLIALSIGVLIYTFWPGNAKRFHRAKDSIMNDENGPWR